MVVSIALLFSLASKNSSQAVKEGNDAATCRAQFSGVITDARTNLDDARADIQKATYVGLKAATVAKDPALLASSTKVGDAATVRAAHWQAETLKANDRYQKLLTAEVEDNDQFVALCKQGP